uniref:Uncharacterized protein n=1 Tax=Leersia perrieri TaxID=77586 RepID=A0A0D9WUZ4_9ORYZ
MAWIDDPVSQALIGSASGDVNHTPRWLMCGMIRRLALYVCGCDADVAEELLVPDPTQLYHSNPHNFTIFFAIINVIYLEWSVKAYLKSDEHSNDCTINDPSYRSAEHGCNDPTSDILLYMYWLSSRIVKKHS